VSQVTDRNMKQVPFDTSSRKHNEEAMDDKVFHDIKEMHSMMEVLKDDKGNDGDDHGEFQDAARNNELVPYDI